MQNQRIIYLDFCKAFGMYLVYYGHFIEKLYYAGIKILFWELKLIYSFHVPLFFFIAGIFWKPNSTPLWNILIKKIRTRILPVLMFSLITIPFFLLWDRLPLSALLGKVKYYMIGQPMLNWVTWFLICLFSVEVIVSIISKITQLTRKVNIPLCILFLFVIGFFLTENFQYMALNMPMNFWFINEAFVAAGFYLSGYLIRPILEKPCHKLLDACGLMVFGILLIITFDLNQGAFKNQHAIVLMNASSHGNYMLFIFTAFTGITFSIFLSRLISLNTWLFNYVGINTLIYLGLNGICLHFLDVKVIYKIGFIPETLLQSNLYAIVYVSAVIVLFAPIVFVLKKIIPKWIFS